MAERDYSQRDVLDKLGVKPGMALVFDEEYGPLEAGLRARVLERAGRPRAGEDEQVDLVLLTAGPSTDVTGLLRKWKARLKPAGGIWVLRAKRGLPGYVDQRLLIESGLAAGLVDNKGCSVSESTGGLRFVIRKADRPR